MNKEKITAVDALLTFMSKRQGAPVYEFLNKVHTNIVAVCCYLVIHSHHGFLILFLFFE